MTDRYKAARLEERRPLLEVWIPTRQHVLCRVGPDALRTSCGKLIEEAGLPGSSSLRALYIVRYGPPCAACAALNTEIEDIATGRKR